jgi:ribose transport system ATP-binding protein
VAVLYVSHRLPEILQIADVVSVMRDGRLVRSGPCQDFDEAGLVTSMLGRPLVRHAGRRTSARDEVAFESAGLARAGVFGPVDLTIRRGEIVGMAGLIGSGRSEFAQTVIGRDKLTSGQLTVAGRPVSIRSVRQAVQRGVGYVPEERQAQGLFLALSSKSNVSMAALDRIQSWGVVSPRRENRYVRDALARLSVKGDINAPVSTLSGGTQQKVLLGRWLALQPSVLILDEPTRGIDVGAKAEIYRHMATLADEGISIIMVSSDMEEIIGMSDRVVVMHERRIKGVLPREGLTQQRIATMMTGRMEGEVAA